jgi:hypothetical protein
MPNVDFERSIISNRLAKTLNSPDTKHRLLGVKAYLDYEDQDIVRINFLDTLRPELWCLEGLARHLEPLPERQYGLHLIESLPRLDIHFEKLPMDNNAWVLYVEVVPGQKIFDDAYFLKKVRDQIGFGSRQNIDVTILPGMQHTLSIETSADDNSRGRFIAPIADLSALGGYSDNQIIMPPLILETGNNTVVITALDQRVGAWLFFALLCNYLDRGYKINGFASSIDEKELFVKWSPFVISDQQIAETFGLQPGHEKFRMALESMHYHVQYDGHAQAWHITPPIFRFDIIHPIDILEDYLVATYYEEARPAPLISVDSMGSQTRRSELEERLIDYMQVYGARQTIGLLLDSYENLVERMCHDAPQRLVHLVNAVNKNREYAVDSSLPPLLRNAVHPSAPLPPATFYLFTETLFLDEQRVAHSRWKMGILLVGPDHPFNNAHTLLDALCFHLHLDYSLKRSTSRALIPGRQMTVFVGDTPIGQLGEVHPEVLTRWDLFYPASFIELDLDSITELWGGN